MRKLAVGLTALSAPIFALPKALSKNALLMKGYGAGKKAIQAAESRCYTLFFSVGITQPDGKVEVHPAGESEMQMVKKTADGQWVIHEGAQPIASRTYKIGDSQIEVTSVNWDEGTIERLTVPPTQEVIVLDVADKTPEEVQASVSAWKAELKQHAVS